jgi:hypothetical protein
MTQCKHPAKEGSTYCERCAVVHAVHLEYFGEKSSCFRCKNTGTGAYCDHHQAEFNEEVERRMAKQKTAADPVHCVNCRVCPVDGDSDYCVDCDKEMKEANEDDANVGERADADSAAADAPAPCASCRAKPAVAYSLCEGCRTNQLAEQQRIAEKSAKQEAAWKALYEKEVAEKKRKAAAEQAAIEEYYPATSRCEKCRSNKTQLLGYCDKHQEEINAAFLKRLSGR